MAAGSVCMRRERTRRACGFSNGNVWQLETPWQGIVACSLRAADTTLKQHAGHCNFARMVPIARSAPMTCPPSTQTERAFFHSAPTWTATRRWNASTAEALHGRADDGELFLEYTPVRKRQLVFDDGKPEEPPAYNTSSGLRACRAIAGEATWAMPMPPTLSPDAAIKRATGDTVQARCWQAIRARRRRVRRPAPTSQLYTDANPLWPRRRSKQKVANCLRTSTPMHAAKDEPRAPGQSASILGGTWHRRAASSDANGRHTARISARWYGSTCQVVVGEGDKHGKRVSYGHRRPRCL